jgi:glyoxylase-like metal-dependent hydrolase (beta-lactamase superfamily II)
MVTVFKDMPVVGIEVIPCRLNGPRGIVKAFLLHDGDGLTLVDTGYGPDDAERIVSRIEAIGRTVSELKSVVLTHAHGDHVGGLARLREIADFAVISHVDEAAAIENRSGAPVDDVVRDGGRIEGLPGVTVVHMPGHTPGSIGLYDARSKSFLAGDAILSAGEHAVVSPPYLCADPAAARASVERLIASGLDIQTLLVAHGDDIYGDAPRALKRIFDGPRTD